MNGKTRRPSGQRHGLRNEIARSWSTSTQIVEAIRAGCPPTRVLNDICATLDWQIGNVVSLISLFDDESADLPGMSRYAKRFGLSVFALEQIFSESNLAVGSLAIYSCFPGVPCRIDRELIGRALSLAAIAISRGNPTFEHETPAAGDAPLLRGKLIRWPTSRIATRD